MNVGGPSAHYVRKQEDGADYLLQYAVQGETIYYRLLGDNDDVVEHGTISKRVLALLGAIDYAVLRKSDTIELLQQ